MQFCRQVDNIAANFRFFRYIYTKKKNIRSYVFFPHGPRVILSQGNHPPRLEIGYALTHVSCTPGNRAIVDIRLRLRCAIPPPPSRLINRIAFDRKFSEYYLRLHSILNDPFCCIIPFAATLQRLMQRRLPMLLNGQDNPENCPLPLGSAPHLIHGSVSTLESSSKTACRSVQPCLHSAP